MRFKVTRDCVDFSGLFCRQGDIIDLPEGEHSRHLKPLDPPKKKTTRKRKAEPKKKKVEG